MTTIVDSIAASIASVIAQAGDHRQMLTGSQMMIHNAHGLAMGDDQDMEEMAALLRKQTDNIAGIYAERAGGDQEHFLSLMKAETWMDPAEAVDEGLVDAIIKPGETDTLENKVDWTAFAESIGEIDWQPSRPSKADWAALISSDEIT